MLIQEWKAKLKLRRTRFCKMLQGTLINSISNKQKMLLDITRSFSNALPRHVQHWDITGSSFYLMAIPCILGIYQTHLRMVFMEHQWPTQTRPWSVALAFQRWGEMRESEDDYLGSKSHSREAGPRGGILTVSKQCSEGSRGHSLREDAQAQA